MKEDTENFVEHSMSGKRFMQLQTGTETLTEEEKADGWYMCECGEHNMVMNSKFTEAAFCTCKAKKSMFGLGKKKAAIDFLPTDKGVIKIGEDEPIESPSLLKRIFAAVKAFLRGK